MKPTTSDKIGITASFLCLVHCLALPLIFAFSAEALHAFEHEYPFIDYIFAVAALIAAYFSSRNTENKKVKIFFAIGWILFIIGVLFHNYPILVYSLHTGSLILIITHIYNLRHCNVKFNS